MSSEASTPTGTPKGTPKGPEGTEKTRILSGLTHELRTPLGSILMMSELLAENGSGNLDEREIRYAQNIHRAVSDLLELVDQVGEMARLEAGRVKTESRDVEPATLARRLEEDAAGRSEEGTDPGKVQVEVEVAPDAPASLRSDPAKLQHTLGLLVESARKVSRDGTVRVRLGGAPDGGLQVTVRDSGPPLTEEEAGALFLPFASAGPRTSRQFGGSGLGLPLARALAESLDGTLGASCTAEGCCYTLTIPQG